MDEVRRSPGQFNRDFYLENFYRIEGLTPTQMLQIEEGDFTPITQRLLGVQEGPPRDALVLQFDQIITDLERKVEIALGAAEEHGDTVAYAKLKDILDQLNRLTDEVRTFHSGK